MFEKIYSQHLDKFLLYEKLYLQWNKKINLTSKSQSSNFKQRHVIDCLQLCQLIPEQRNVVDIGSGMGLPGIILAVSLPQDMILVEPNQKKATFLLEVKRQLELNNVKIYNCRWQDVDFLKHTPFLITSRAFTSLSELFAMHIQIQQNLQKNILGVYPKGKSWQEELSKAKECYQVTYETFSSVTDDHSRIIKVNHVEEIVK